MAEAPVPDVRHRAAIEQAQALLMRGQLAEAERALSPLLAASPKLPQALHLLGGIRRAQGDFVAAETLYRQALSLDPAQPLLHQNLGSLLSRTERPAEAVAAFAEAVRLKPNFAEAHLGLALALSDTGDHLAAERSCRDALKYQPNYLAARQALASELCALGKGREAEQVLRRALAAGIRDPYQAAALEHGLALALKQQGRLEEALVLFDTAQARVPDLPAVDFNRAGTLQQLGRIEEALEAYRRAVARAPDHAESLAGLALMAALLGDADGAADAATKALSRVPGHALAAIALAIAQVGHDKIAEAEAGLQSAIAQSHFLQDPQATFALGFAGDSFEQKGAYDRAFEIYRRANAARRALFSRFAPARAIDDVRRLREYFDAGPAWPARPAPAPPTNAPDRQVFILGFMRSGTTLLETILAMNPAVAHIDEIEFLTDAAREFLLDSEGLSRLAGLGENDMRHWRARYWKAVSDSGVSLAGKIFVDKMPFNSLRLPLIARLFPDAKVIFAVRDPRDVVISCFRRRFDPTPFSYEFLDLADCARFYAQSMALVELYRAKLPLAVHAHRYEDMVVDFHSSVTRVCDFAGLAYSPAMHEFREAAGKVDRRSASASQVRRGLYREGVGQWRHYREQMKPVMPILEPWIERFGYEAA